jgi:threonine dehydrogenase-like Zn-dependent dehydrogenase
MELTHGRGADACIDAVGTEAEARASADSMLDRANTAVYLGTDRPHVLRKRSIVAATSAPSPSSVCTADFSIKFRWAQPSIAD